MSGIWPSNQLKTYRQDLRTYYPDFYARWDANFERAFAGKGLDRREEAIIVAALHGVLHSAPEIIEEHIGDAFDNDASVVEVLEAMLRVGVQEGQHALSSGGEALWSIVERRAAEGRPVKERGRVMTEAEVPPHAPWHPVQFPYQTPHPRYWRQLINKYDPERGRIMETANAAQSKLPAQLSRRMIELIDVSVDAVVRWKTPRLDHHIHEAFHCGSNVQELFEVTLVSAEAAQFSYGSHISARRSESALEIIHHGLQALHRVIEERTGVGMDVKMDYTT